MSIVGNDWKANSKLSARSHNKRYDDIDHYIHLVSCLKCNLLSDCIQNDSYSVRRWRIKLWYVIIIKCFSLRIELNEEINFVFPQTTQSSFLSSLFFSRHLRSFLFHPPTFFCLEWLNASSNKCFCWACIHL